MVVWNSTVNTRVRAKEPILVNKLVSRLKLLLIHDLLSTYTVLPINLAASVVGQG